MPLLPIPKYKGKEFGPGHTNLTSCKGKGVFNV